MIVCSRARSLSAPVASTNFTVLNTIKRTFAVLPSLDYRHAPEVAYFDKFSFTRHIMAKFNWLHRSTPICRTLSHSTLQFQKINKTLSNLMKIVSIRNKLVSIQFFFSFFDAVTVDVYCTWFPVAIVVVVPPAVRSSWNDNESVNSHGKKRARMSQVNEKVKGTQNRNKNNHAVL